MNNYYRSTPTAAGKAKQTMLIESRAHRAVSLLRTIPPLGPIRGAFIVATVDTPHRFRTKRQFWSYVGLAVVTHMSAEEEMKAGRVVRCRKPISTRGTPSHMTELGPIF
jgi:transposase